MLVKNLDLWAGLGMVFHLSTFIETIFNHTTSNFLQGNSEHSPGRRQRHFSQENSHSTGNHTPKSNVPRQDGLSNGAMQKHANSHGNGKVLIIVVLPFLLVVNVRNFLVLHIRVYIIFINMLKKPMHAYNFYTGRSRFAS